MFSFKAGGLCSPCREGPRIHLESQAQMFWEPPNGVPHVWRHHAFVNAWEKACGRDILGRHQPDAYFDCNEEWRRRSLWGVNRPLSEGDAGEWTPRRTARSFFAADAYRSAQRNGCVAHSSLSTRADRAYAETRTLKLDVAHSHQAAVGCRPRHRCRPTADLVRDVEWDLRVSICPCRCRQTKNYQDGTD